MPEMTALLAEPWGGLLVLAALLLWPGLLIVRAPWPFVPFLSLSFWLVSWDWLPSAGPGRHRFLVVTLAFSALFSGLRLLKPLEASRPSWPTLVTLTAALSRLAPFFLWPVTPGLDAGFSSASALLLEWRDGLPASYLPLYPILGFGLGDAGLATLAADISLLARIPPHRALLLATLASEGLFVLALFAFARRFWSASWSALGAVTLAALGLLVVARAEAAGGTPLALALVTSGAALVLHARGRSARVAAGVLWAGAAAACAPLAAAGGVATLATIVATRRSLGRLGLAVFVASLFVAPLLWRSTDAGRLSAPDPLPTALLLLIVTLIPVTAGRWPWPDWKRWGFLVCGSVAFLATGADWSSRSARVAVSADDFAAGAWLRDHSGATDVVCAREESARAWIPALAGRAASPPRWPHSVRASRVAPLAPCRFLWGPAGPAASPAAFRKGGVSVTRLFPAATDTP
jgi:hypothetical protein